MELEFPQVLLSLLVGMGLSAACGFRIFVPLTIMSLASKAEYVELSSGFEWVGSTPAMMVFLTATVFEIGAYYIPWVDNLLDALAAPTAVMAGTLVTATQIGDMNPVMTWTLSAILGGGSAGVVQSLTTAARSVSSFATGGLGNPIVSTVEAGASIVTPILVILLGVPMVLAMAVAMMWLAKKIFTRRKGQMEIQDEAGSEVPA